MSRLREDGLTYREIAAELGCSKSHVHRVLRRGGVVEPPPYRVPIGRAVALLDRGYPVRQVAGIVGCSVSGLRHRLRAIGYPAATLTKVCSSEEKQMIEMWQRGMGLVDVARRLRRHPDTVRNHLCRVGVYQRRSQPCTRWHSLAVG